MSKVSENCLYERKIYLRRCALINFVIIVFAFPSCRMAALGKGLCELPDSMAASEKGVLERCLNVYSKSVDRLKDNIKVNNLNYHEV